MRQVRILVVAATVATFTSGCLLVLVDWSDPWGRRPPGGKAARHFDTTAISGVISDAQSGEPLAGATVFAYSKEFSDKVGTTVSGEFIVRVVKNTMTDVVVHGPPGYYDKTDHVSVEAEPVEKGYRLAKRPASTKQ